MLLILLILPFQIPEFQLAVLPENPING